MVATKLGGGGGGKVQVQKYSSIFDRSHLITSDGLLVTGISWPKKL